MSFNNFLSTSKTHDVSLLFVDRMPSNPDLVGILFVITIDPSVSSAPFASIDSISQFQVEEEVLFAMHTVFRIGEITLMGEKHRLSRVELILTSDNDPDLRQLTARIREETFPNNEGWYRLGLVLLKMGQSEKAQQVYEILLEQATEESGKASIYNQLGMIKYNQGTYQEAITFYQKSLEILKKTRPSNDPDLGMSYNNIGMVYYKMGDYTKALLSYEKALEIRQQSLPPNHPDLGASYNNIGLVYFMMGDYSKALSSHEKALAIKQQSLPPNHPSLGGSYNNIGSLYGQMGEHAKALPYFEKTLAIQQQSLPPNHPDLGMSYNNIGVVYEEMGDYSKARSFCERAVEIGQQSLPPNHPNRLKWQKHLEDIK
jgi:tetratricopeptide (TPR) repeat protein